MDQRWHPSWQDPKGAMLLPEDRWFDLFQPLLVQIANTDYGRSLLNIEEGPPVVRVLPNCVTRLLGRSATRYALQADFRTAPKWGNLIRHRWDQFQSYARYFQSEDNGVSLSPLVRYARSVVASSATFFPDPGSPAAAAVDGQVGFDNGAVAASFATFRAGAGNSSDDTTSGMSFAELDASTTSNTYIFLSRSIILFNTASLTSGASISAATLSLFGDTGITTDNFSQSLGIVSSNPASNIGLAATDFAIARFGSTEFATRKTSASWSTAYNDFVLNASGIANISKTSISKFGARLSSDLDNAAPTWSSSGICAIVGQFADTDGTDQDPKLVVTYTLPAGIAVPSFFGHGSAGHLHL